MGRETKDSDTEALENSGLNICCQGTCLGMPGRPSLQSHTLEHGTFWTEDAGQRSGPHKRLL